MSKLRLKLIRWALENDNEDFLDYLFSMKGTYKTLLTYYNSIN